MFLDALLNDIMFMLYAYRNLTAFYFLAFH